MHASEDAACSGPRHPNESAAAVSLHFAVRDTGCGMTPDMQATLFDRYRSIGGVGLGLYLTKRQVELMGGRMEVQSPWQLPNSQPNGQPGGQPGAQFAFTLQLPLVAESSSSAVVIDMGQRVADDAEVPPRLPAELKVLIADDSRMNRKILRAAFERHCSCGWAVTETATAEDAVQLCDQVQASFDLIIMDEIFDLHNSSLRGSAAIQLIRNAEQRLSARPAVMILCTGNACTCPVGADAVWQKPFPDFTTGQLQEQLGRMLSCRSSAQGWRQTEN